MALTVRDVLDLPPLTQGIVVAGKSGLDHEIKSLSVLEVVNKGYTSERFMEPNIFTISSLYAIADDVGEQLKLIRMLHNHQVSALALFNVGEVIPEISEEVIALCDELQFPLIRMPLHISYYDTIYAIFDQLFAQQAYRLKSSTRIYETFLDQQLSFEGDISRTLDTLGELIHTRLAFYNFHQKCLYSSWKGGETLPEEVLNQIDLCSFDPVEAADVSYHGVSFLIQPVSNNNINYGVLVLEGLTSPVSELTALAISQACRVLCITLVSNERREEFQLRKRRTYLLDLVAGNFGADKMLIHSQGKTLGYPIDEVDRVLVVDVHSEEGEDRRPLSALFHSIAEQVMPAAGVVIPLELPENGELILLLSEKNASSIPYAGKLVASLLAAENVKASIGVGPPCDGAEKIAFCYDKARQAIRIARRLFPQLDRPYALYEDVEVFDLLLESVNREQAAKLTARMFEELDRYDEKNNSQLTDTFFELLISNVSTAWVSQRMYLHKNTVLQRKNKIARFYPDDPFEGRNHLRYELGFILKKLFDL